MSPRDGLGTAVAQVHERVDSLLDSEDAMIVLVDDARAISYAHGFGLSPSQLELLALEVERNRGSVKRRRRKSCFTWTQHSTFAHVRPTAAGPQGL